MAERKHKASRQRRGWRRHSDQETIQSFIPDYLSHLITPYYGEFCCTPVFHPRLIAQLMAEGFLPIATEGALLPKLHQQRCVISLPNDLHVSKSVRKKSKKFRITVNASFDQVVQGCHQQHGTHCWLYPPLVSAFRIMKEVSSTDASIMDSKTGEPTGRKAPVRLYSVEVWNDATGELAGGELGYTVGSIYTSLTGFSKESSAGSVQLAALGKLLCSLGFSLWDLGMDMEYKRGLGSHLMARKTFLREVFRVRESFGHLVLPVGEPVNAKSLIDGPAELPSRKVHEPPSQEESPKQKKPRSSAAAKLPASLSKSPDKVDRRKEIKTK